MAFPGNEGAHFTVFSSAAENCLIFLVKKKKTLSHLASERPEGTGDTGCGGQAPLLHEMTYTYTHFTSLLQIRLPDSTAMA